MRNLYLAFNRSWAFGVVVFVFAIFGVSAKDLKSQVAQIRPVDWVEIEDQTLDPKSPYFFDLLMYRYMKEDTMLNAVDYYYLYYGYSLQADYCPDSVSVYSDSLEVLMQRTDMAKDVQLGNAEYYLKRILDVQPFSIRDLNALAFVYNSMGMDKNAQEQMYKLEMIDYTIKSSGEGVKKDSPWEVISHQNAQDVMALMGYGALSSRVISSDELYLWSSDSKSSSDGLYFDFTPVNRYLAVKLREQEKQAEKDKPARRKMEFNSLYNPWSKNSILPK